MTVDELESLIKRAEDVLGCKVSFYRAWDGKCSVNIFEGPSSRDLRHATADECIARLKKWATPPKPDMLAVMVPTEHCEAIIASVNANGFCQIASASPIVAEMVAALAPYQEQP